MLSTQCLVLSAQCPLGLILARAGIGMTFKGCHRSTVQCHKYTCKQGTRFNAPRQYAEDRGIPFSNDTYRSHHEIRQAALAADKKASTERSLVQQAAAQRVLDREAAARDMSVDATFTSEQLSLAVRKLGKSDFYARIADTIEDYGVDGATVASSEMEQLLDDLEVPRDIKMLRRRLIELLEKCCPTPAPPVSPRAVGSAVMAPRGFAVTAEQAAQAARAAAERERSTEALKDLNSGPQLTSPTSARRYAES